MDMKKIAFITRSLGVGGVEKSLIGLINSMPEEDFDITVFITVDDRRMAFDIKRKIKIEYLEFRQYTAPQVFLNYLKTFQLRRALKFLGLRIGARTKNGERNREAMWAQTVKQPKEKFDAAISYYLPDTYELFLNTECIRSKKKLAWMHMDVEKYAPRMPSIKKYYKAMKRVYCVSADVKEKFGKIYPELKDRARVFHNIIDADEIVAMSEEYPIEKKGTAIFTCARVSIEKQPLMCAEALKALVDGGIDAYWYWAGGDTNGYTKKLLTKLKELKIEDRFILLGALTNPYPYYRACDVYVQTSEHESYCIAVAEAKILCGRIVCTEFPAAHEQLTLSPACAIVAQNSAAVADGIKAVLSAPPQQFKTAAQSEEIKRFKEYLNGI